MDISLKSSFIPKIPKNQDFLVHLNQSKAVATLNQKGGRHE